MVDSPAYRLNHEEVDQGARRGHRVRREPRTRSKPCPTSTARVSAMVFKREGRPADGPASDRRCRRGRCSSPPGTSPNITYEKERRARSSSTRRRSSSSRITRVERTATAVSRSTPDPRRLLHVLRRRRPVRHLLRRQPSALRRQRRQGDGVGQARLSARRRRCSRDELARARSGAAAGARRGVGSAGRDGSTTSCSRASRTSCG